MKHLSLQLIGFTLAAALGATAAYADVYTVGSGAGCTHGTIQAAVDAADARPGADTVRITRSLAYPAQSITVNTSQSLDIVGGFATCTQSASDDTHTVVSGSGASDDAVFRIAANGSAIVKLRGLDIQYGSHYGIYFKGSGIVQTQDSTISRNGYNGIYAEATNNNAELVVDAGTLVIDNGSDFLFPGTSGGGVALRGPIEMTMTAPQTMIAFNRATYGGGIVVGAGAYAYIGSPGYGGLPALYQNHASRNGGGAYVGGTLKLFATDPAHTAGVSHNDADSYGGGVYVGSSGARLCAWDFAIDANSAEVAGAAIFGTNGGTVVLNRDDYAQCTPHPEAVRCAFGTACNSISDNVANGADAGIVELSSSLLDAKRLRMQRNQATFGIHGLDSDVRLNACLIVDNTVSKRLLDTYGADNANSLFVDSCTLARNTIGEAVIYATRKSWLTNNIIDQPSNLVADLSSEPGMSYADSLLVTSTGGLPIKASIVLADPAFVDAAHGDYHLRLASPAIDFAGTDTFFSDADLDGNPRNVDLPNVANRYGPRDLGAYEWNPLILNGWFDADLSFWTRFAGAWDGTQNAAGNSGSGSWKMQQNVTPPIDPGRPDATTSGDYAAGEQCIRLPGPGRYLLNGWGKGGGNMMFHDSAVVAWELRRNGGEDCGGTPDTTGELTLGSSASWTHPAQPAAIDLSTADFHAGHSTIKVRLIGRSGFPSGTMTVWFDGITLENASSSEVIFASGFD